MTEIKDGKIVINIDDILGNLSPEESIKIAESMGCQDAVIRAVGSQIIHGVTDSGYYGWEALISPVRRGIIENHNEVAKREIERLDSEILFLKEVEKNLRGRLPKLGEKIIQLDRLYLSEEEIDGLDALGISSLIRHKLGIGESEA